MDYKPLIAQAEVRGISPQDFDLPTLPKDSRHHLSFVAKRHRKDFAACIRQERFAETLTLSSYPAASSVWYADRRIRLIVWDGDLAIDGAGTVDARKFDNLDATEEALRAAFVDEALIEEDGEIYLDKDAVFERASAGLAVWR